MSNLPHLPVHRDWAEPREYRFRAWDRMRLRDVSIMIAMKPPGIDQEYGGGRRFRDPGPEPGQVKLVHGTTPLPPRVLVFFGSKPDKTENAGEAIPASTPFDQIHMEMLKIARKDVDLVSAWHGAVPTSHPGSGSVLGSFKNDRGVDGAIKDIGNIQKKNKLAKVIVYGYSLGGTSALDLSRRLALTFPKGQIRLLITIDAAVPFSSDKVDREVGPAVIWNHNIFQTNPHFGSGSCGGRNSGGTETTGIINEDRTALYKDKDGHILIHGDTVAYVITLIRREYSKN